MRKASLSPALAVLLLLTGALAAADVQAGFDFMVTPPGATTVDFSGSPLPAGFFDPGSDPVTAQLQLQGIPFEFLSPLTYSDTIIERKQSAILPSVPSSGTVDIQIVALNLESVQPLTVTYGGLGAQLWDVRVGLSDQPQMVGTMLIDIDCPEGGTFDSNLPVAPKLVFTRRSDQAVRVYDSATIAFTMQSTGSCWVHDPRPTFDVIDLPPGSVVDFDVNLDGVPEQLVIHSSNFVAGIGVLSCGGNLVACPIQEVHPGFGIHEATCSDTPLCGDCSLSGFIDILDALTASQLAAGLLTPTPLQQRTCDVDVSGGIDVLDGLIIAYVAAGLPDMRSCYPGEPPVATISSPTGGTLVGDISIAFTSSDLDDATLDFLLEWSSNGGITRHPATPAPTAAAPFNSSAVTAAANQLGATFLWDSNADVQGLQAIEFRVLCADGKSRVQGKAGFSTNN